MDLRLKTSDGKSFQLEGVSGATTVLELKRQCASRCGFAAAHQRLFSKGKPLRDEDTLGAAVPEKASLFLTKAPTWAEEMSRAPAGTVPCAGGCGRFGTPRNDNYCSGCFARQPQQERSVLWRGILHRRPARARGNSPAELLVGDAVRIHGLKTAVELNGRRGWIVKYMEETSRFGVRLKGHDETKAIRAANLRRLGSGAALKVKKVLIQKDKTRCWQCSKKCGLTGFSCRCGFVFCSKHRYAEDHACSFDHRAHGRELLARNITKLQPSALDLLARA